MSRAASLAPTLPDDRPTADGATRIQASPSPSGVAASRVLGRLKWATVLIPVLLIELTHLTVVAGIEPLTGALAAHIIEVVVIAVGAFLFSSAVFAALGRMQGRIVLQNRELSALNAVSRAVSGSLDQREVLSRALENVLRAMDAEAGEIAVRVAGGQRVQSGAESALFAGLGQELDDQPSGARLLAEMGSAGDAAVAAGFRAVAWAPLLVRQRSIGTMIILSRAPERLLTDDAPRLLDQMAAHVALAVEMSRLFVDVERRSSEAEALYRVGLEISSLQELPHILRSVVDEARELLAADMAILCLADASGLRVAAHSGELPLSHWSGDNGGCPVRDADGSVARLEAVLKVGDQSVGELCVLAAAPQAFEARQQRVLAGLAEMAAIAIDNARLVERERYMAVLEERDRLAREMHDSLAQVLGYLQFKTRIARNALADGKPEKALGELDEMEQLAGDAYDDVREAILGLRELHPDRELSTSVREYLEKFTRQSGVRASLEVEEGAQLPELAPEAQVQLVRVIQEALTNVRKHARATQVRVRFGTENGDMKIAIEDDGCGFDPEAVAQRAGQRFGVWTMRERVELLGGRFAIDSAPGRGTSVVVRLPVKGSGE